MRPKKLFCDFIRFVSNFGLCLLFICCLSWVRGYYSDNENSETNNTISESASEIVLFAGSTLFGRPWERSYSCPIPNTSKYINCIITPNPGNNSKISAVIYHQFDLNKASLEQDYLNWSQNDIPMILANMESPAYHPFPDQYLKYFTFFSNHHVDSDFPWPYAVLKKRDEPQNVDLEAIWKEKDDNKTVAWIVSNCGSLSQREKIVKALQQAGLQVDIFGTCGFPLPNCERSKFLDHCRKQLTKTYKFYFAFENSICTDYVTEKLFTTMEAENVVPIVLKRSIVDRIGIPEKAVIALDSYKNAEEAVKGLKELGRNKERYLEHLQWIQDYEVEKIEGDYGPCNACRHFHQPPSEKKKASKPKSWTTEAQCDQSFAIRFLGL